MEAWPCIVGPALARSTTPRRLAQGTLTIGCTGPVAMELQHLATELTARINQYLGSQTIKRLRFTQSAGARAPFATRPYPNAASNADIVLAASEAVAHMRAGPLRDALLVLGRAVLSESASRLGTQPHTRF
jgi:hypothetical protein